MGCSLSYKRCYLNQQERHHLAFPSSRKNIFTENAPYTTLESKNLIILFVYEKIISKFSDFRLNKLIIMIILAYFF